MANIDADFRFSDFATHASVSRIKRCSGVTTPFAVNSFWFYSALWIGAASVVLLGWFREYYVLQYGVETPVQDLRHFALDTENSVPVWFSSMLMMVSVLLMLLIKKCDHTRFRRSISFWGLLALVFIAMSIDETSSFREVLILLLQSKLGAIDIFHFSWVVAAIPVLALFAWYILPDLLRLPLRWVIRFATSGIIYISGALGMEMLGGYFASSEGMDALSYIVTAAIEETLEILGLTLFAGFLFGYLKELTAGLQLKFD